MKSLELTLRPWGDLPSQPNALDFRAEITRVPVAAYESRFDFKFAMTAASQLSRSELSRLVWPAFRGTGALERRDELWKSTCFELFISTATSKSYVELNLSPSGDWNLYSFDDYREGMKAIEGEVIWTAESLKATERSLSGTVVLSLSVEPVVLGATAVLEYQDGTKEYWAAAHAGETPDFHLRASFMGSL